MTNTAIESLLDQELAAVADVLVALEAESRALADRDPAALATAVARKTAALGRAAGLEDQRRELLGSHAGPEHRDDPASLPDARGGKDTAIAGQLGRLKDLARRCRDLNDRNGALIRAQRQRVEGSLSLLQGGRQGGSQGRAETYGPDGSTRSGAGRRGQLATW